MSMQNSRHDGAHTRGLTRAVLLVAILTVPCGTATAQIVMPIPCSPNTAVTQTLRAEGLSELVGDVLFYCYGPVPLPLQVSMTLNVNVTNNRNYLGANVTDAVLVPDVPCYVPPGGGPCPIPATYGMLQPDNRTLIWQVTAAVLPPGSAMGFRVTNVRAAVFGLPAGQMVPAQVTATVTLSAAGFAPTISPGMVVGYVQPGLGVNLAAPGIESFRLRLQEAFPTAWKPLGIPAGGGVYGPTGQEDGFYTPGSGKNDGGATQGTRILIRFLNAPGGAHIVLPNILTSGSSSMPPSPPAELRRVPNADASGAGGCYDCAPAPPPGSVGDATPNGKDAYAVYEVANATPYMIDSVEVPVFLCKGNPGEGGCHVLAGTIALKDLKVKASLAPVAPPDTGSIADTQSPRPRFVETGVPIDLLRWPR